MFFADLRRNKECNCKSDKFCICVKNNLAITIQKSKEEEKRIKSLMVIFFPLFFLTILLYLFTLKSYYFDEIKDYDETYKTYKVILNQDVDFKNYLKKENILFIYEQEERLKFTLKDKKEIEKKLKENKYVRSIMEKYSLKNVNEIYEYIVPEITNEYSFEYKNYLKEYENYDFKVEIEKSWNEKGYISLYETKYFENLKNNTETKDKRVLISEKILPNNKELINFKKERNGKIKEKDVENFINVFLKEIKKKYPEYKNKDYIYYHDLEEITKTEKESLKKEIEKINKKHIKEKYSEYISDDMIINLEKEILKKLIENQEIENYLNEKASNYAQLAYFYAKENKYKGLEDIERSYEKKGFIDIRHKKILSKIFEKNYPNYEDELFNTFEKVFRKLNEQEVNSIKKYYLKDCNEALLKYKEVIKDNLLNEIDRTEIISVYVEYCYEY